MLDGQASGENCVKETGRRERSREIGVETDPALYIHVKDLMGLLLCWEL